MSWRDELQKASFKNVEFEVDLHDFDTGRRGQMHEYPNRDKPYFEDLGRKSRSITIQAFVIGDDYRAKRDALISACEESGAGKLVHPFLGSMDVTNIACRLSEAKKEGRMARFSLTFVETGELNFPTSVINSNAAVGESSDKLKDTVSDYFQSQYSVQGLPGFVADHSKSTLITWTDGTTTEVNSSDVAEKVENAKLNIGKIVRSSALIVDTVSGITGGLREGNYLSALSSSSQFFSNTDLIPTTTKTRLQEASNVKALNMLIRSVSLAEEGRALIATEFNSYQDAIGAATNFAHRINNEVSTGPAQTSSELYNRFNDLSAKVVTSIRSEATNLAKITTTSSPDPQPSLVTAYQIYGDATRENEIVTRNNIRHPSFLPPVTELEVLSK